VLLYGQTDIGQIRSSNQDVYQIETLDDNACFGIVCDGMGGENGGQIASAVASQVICEELRRNYKSGLSDDDYKDIIIEAVSDGNVAVYEKAKGNPLYKGMGTTGVLALVVGNKAYIAHVGDSRLYLLRDEELYQITHDHSIVQALLDQGKITPEEAARHPQKNMITRAIGVSRFVDIDYIEVSTVEDSSLLLCSDGLTNTVSDELIKNVMLERKPEEVCDTLIRLANHAGGMDNITVVYMTRS